MKKRDRFGKLVGSWAVALIVVLVLGGVWQVMAGPEEAPRAALLAVTWNTAGIAANTNATAQLVQHYAYHDLYCSIDQNVANGITITMMTSPDNTYWFTYTALIENNLADTTVFTRMVSYGRYEQLRFTVSNANTVTPVCKSVYFNNWMPSGLIDSY